MLKSPPELVFDYLTTHEGRSRFWAESAQETHENIHFKFINGWEYEARIIELNPNQLFKLEYFNSEVTFKLMPYNNGTELHLLATGVSEEEYNEVHAGWVSVLLALKVAVDHGIDIRNHDPLHCWDQKFVEN